MTTGTPGTLATVQSVGGCTDPALRYIGCDDWLSKAPSSGDDYKGTVVVIDDPLSVDQWKSIEATYSDGVRGDIIKYVYGVDTFYYNGIRYSYAKTMGAKGVDSLSGVSDSTLGNTGQAHGYSVTGILASVVRNVNVIFVSIYADDLATSDTIWRYLYNNINTYNIVGITMSWLVARNAKPPVRRVIRDLFNEGVFISASAGNEGANISRSVLFPQSLPEVYTIGSVDHENRGKWVTEPYLHYDSDYYSVKGKYSGFSQDARDNPGRCSDASKYPFCSNYGYGRNGTSALDFVMPGYGIPYPYGVGAARVWRYGVGTSFSEPYFAAAVLIAHYAYNLGYFAESGRYARPGRAVIYQILLHESSRSTFATRYGYGYLDVFDVYNYAYSVGVAAGFTGGSLNSVIV